MPAVVSDDALRLPGRARCVEDIERIGGINADARLQDSMLAMAVHPIVVPPGPHRRRQLRTLKDDT